MTRKVLDWRLAVIDAPEAVLASTTVLVLVVLSVYMDDEGYCFPSIRRLMKNTRLGKTAVIEHLARAVKAGYLRKGSLRNPKTNNRHSNYRIAFPGKVEREGVVREVNLGSPGEPGVVQEVNPNSPRELPKVEGSDDGDDKIVFTGKIIRLSRKDFNARCAKYGLEARRMADWLHDRDKWLATLPRHDKRVSNWWIITWQALERDLESLRICDRYAKTQPSKEPPPEAEEGMPNVVVWG